MKFSNIRNTITLPSKLLLLLLVFFTTAAQAQTLSTLPEAGETTIGVSAALGSSLDGYTSADRYSFQLQAGQCVRRRVVVGGHAEAFLYRDGWYTNGEGKSGYYDKSNLLTAGPYIRYYVFPVLYVQLQTGLGINQQQKTRGDVVTAAWQAGNSMGLEVKLHKKLSAELFAKHALQQAFSFRNRPGYPVTFYTAFIGVSIKGHLSKN
ncbi:MAG: hypothetical protein LPJ89_04400 [Hymenobacteraceae bacterium]|nr:hypothetical protein [Hymenobacteraceae bacterium]MDX5395109.1 hypothetical protein [Hymenobacteraceae bacterium]MDX5443006.1 hypothetical protein [Hymenobacteraceae bacterium]MDX5511147.1 hypothetical protein [Hymenobacteraceae bacterium]